LGLDHEGEELETVVVLGYVGEITDEVDDEIVFIL
jgi:hypothetical protein